MVAEGGPSPCQRKFLIGPLEVQPSRCRCRRRRLRRRLRRRQPLAFHFIRRLHPRCGTRSWTRESASPCGCCTRPWRAVSSAVRASVVRIHHGPPRAPPISPRRKRRPLRLGRRRFPERKQYGVRAVRGAPEKLLHFGLRLHQDGLDYAAGLDATLFYFNRA